MKRIKRFRFFLLLWIAGTAGVSYGQLALNVSMTPQQLVQNVLVGTGVVVTNITYSGSAGAIGSFTNGGTTNIGLGSGVILTSGAISVVPGPNNSGSAGQSNSMPGDPTLQSLIPGYTTYDASVFEFDFVPLSDTIKFRYVFGSDEYPEYANSNYNDVFGFFITGPNPLGGNYSSYNIARLPGTSTPVSINNVNNGTSNGGPCINCQYYINNANGVTIQYDAFTTVLTAWALVTPCVSYHFKIGVADAGDGILDSGVFLEANSFSTDAIEVETEYSIPGAGKSAIEGCNNAIVKFSISKFATDTIWVLIDTMYGTATNGVDFASIPNKAYILPGQKTGSITIAPFIDYITEGTEYITLIIPTSPCTIDTLTIPILDYVPVTLNMMNDTTVCETAAPLWVQATQGAPPYTYAWTPAATLSSASIANPVANTPVTTTYTVTVKDTTACPAVKDSMVVTIVPKPSVSFMPDKFSGCEPVTVNFTDFSAPAITAWNWDFGDGGTSTIKNPTHTYIAGTYSIVLSVTTADGCTGSFAANNLIKVFPMPKPYFDPVPAVAPIDNPVINFNNMTVNGSIWAWNFGDPGSGANNTSSQQHPSHTYNGDGTYTVWLVASTPDGCIDSISRQVMIIIDKIEIPNVITPNSDGFNDVFFIKNIDKLKSSRLIIYNRWGKKVFEMENYDNTWDARNHSDGVYYWTLEYSTFFRDSKEHGTVTVLRDM
ncbi:MAG TPA: choice-of-anchor L domain-containing protein [Bacteroidales bacterium]|nr:choice-of-anchor L domain-containing protein [Bacteroidales bacterium]HRZ49808.1 choice-of-anchor L domain-containing protein [Bacteroidales bacterium]